MKKYLVLYHSAISAADQMAKATPEQAKAGMEAWMAWAGSAGKAIVDLGNPVTGAARLTSPTNVLSSASPVAGFSILQAESTDALTDLLKKHPHFMAPGAAIEVLEYLPMPGM